MKTISLDLESYSSVSLKRTGVYPYAEHPDFEILLFGYAVDGGEVQVVDIAQGEKVPVEILNALVDGNITKWAFNASFERICLSYWLRRTHPEIFSGEYLDPASWRCSLVWSAYNGLPLSLEGVGAVLKLEEQKLSEGKDLIKYFCVPCLPTKSNGGRTRNMPWHALDKWALFKKYNRRDVEAEMAIQRRLQNYPVPENVWQEYVVDQRTNDMGILIDIPLVESAIEMDARSHAELSAEMQQCTALANPNSVAQMKEWLAKNGVLTETLGKKAVADLMAGLPEDIQHVLRLRQQLAKSSVKKYTAMRDMVCTDNRARGTFQFYGAARSGRWAGRHIQLQNLPQNHIPDLNDARALVRSGDYDAVKALYNDVPDTLSQLARTALIPQHGYKFIVADFSAIEARVLAYLAGEQWRLDVFERGGDIYCASASQMFKVPVEKHGVNGHLRQKGKIAELALGYGGGIGALRAMGALSMGLAEEELQPLVDMWRASNPRIVAFWWAVDRAVKETVRMHLQTQTRGITFRWQSGMLFIELPSGRHLSYAKPRIGQNKFGGEAVTYAGTGATKKWERIESYGPKFVENITQAVARDILAYAMKGMQDYRIVAHVHDEVIIEAPMETEVSEVCAVMGRTPPWIEGLCLRADGYEGQYYFKD